MRIACERIVVAPAGSGIAGDQVEHMLPLPNCSVRLWDVKIAEANAVIGRNFKLQIVARLEINWVSRLDWFEHNLSDERCHTAIAENAQSQRRLSTGPCPPGTEQVHEQTAVTAFNGIRAEPSADRRTGRRAIGQLVSSIVLGAFDKAARDETAG